MDGWPNINAPKGGSASSRPAANNLPAPGSVVMASVDEDLGDGKYTLRWGQNRIAVNSQSPLRPGQSLILRSEMSPEGKITLVVQGPAIPDPGSITGRVIYGPGKHHSPGATVEEELQGRPSYGPAGKQGQDVGNQMAAGVSRAVSPQTPQPASSLVGLVLEPLPDLQASVAVLEEMAGEEKKRLEGEDGQKQGAAGKDKAQGGGPDDAAAAGEKNRRPLICPADAGPGPSVRPGTALPPPATPPASQGGQAPPSSATPAAPPLTTATPPSVAPATPQPASPAASPSASPQTPPPSPERPPVAPAESGPRVPDVPETPPSEQTRPADGQRPAAPPSSPPPPASPSPSPSTTPSSAPSPVSPPPGPPPPVPPPTGPAQPPAPSPASPLPGPPPPPAPGAAQQPSGPALPEAPQPASPVPVQPPSPGTAEPSSQPQPQPVPQPLHPAGTGPAVPDDPASPPPAPPPPSSGSASPPPQPPSAPPPASAQQPQPAAPSAPPAGEAVPPRRPEPASGRPPPPPDAHAEPAISREVYQSEALTQMAKASELPLSDNADTRVLGRGGRMPPAVVDKAATILLRAAGLTPDEATLEAARALVRNNVQVDRETIQALIAMAANAPDGGRDAAIQAAARLAAKDIPLAQPLVSGLADVMTRTAGTGELLRRTMAALDISALNIPGAPPEAAAMTRSARELLELLHVDLDEANAGQALERYVSTFGRATLGKAMALVEVSAQAVLENNHALQDIDRAIGRILTLLENDIGRHEQTREGAAGQTAGTRPEQRPMERPAGETAPLRPLPGLAEPLPGAAPAALPDTLPGPVPTRRPINAYLNAPRALPIADMLKNLPPMPKPVAIGDPVPQQIPPSPPPVQARAGAGSAVPPPAPQTVQPVLPPSVQSVPPLTQPVPPSPGQAVPSPSSPQSADAGLRGGVMPEQQEAVLLRQQTAVPEREGGGLLMKLDSLFQTPGLNKAEFELLKPGGFLERYLGSASRGADGESVRREAESLFRELTSRNREGVEKALRELGGRDPEVLRETAARLSRHEGEIMRGDPLLNKLSDAASGLRDLGRQALAVKAENVAGQEREPGVMLAEVPFKLHDDAGDGRMQMFYRRGKGKGDGWSSRVILDLNTTRMGPVLGDMRFFGQDMTLNVFVEKREVAEYLEGGAEGLLDGLWGKGFRVKARFMVLPAAGAGEPRLRAERPEISGENLEGGGDEHRLDVKG